MNKKTLIQTSLCALLVLPLSVKAEDLARQSGEQLGEVVRSGKEIISDANQEKNEQLQNARKSYEEVKERVAKLRSSASQQANEGMREALKGLEQQQLEIELALEGLREETKDTWSKTVANVNEQIEQFRQGYNKAVKEGDAES